MRTKPAGSSACLVDGVFTPAACGAVLCPGVRTSGGVSDSRNARTDKSFNYQGRGVTAAALLNLEASSFAHHANDTSYGPAETLESEKVIELECNAVGRLLYVYLPGENRVLSLSEVEIYGRPQSNLISEAQADSTYNGIYAAGEDPVYSNAQYRIENYLRQKWAINYGQEYTLSHSRVHDPNKDYARFYHGGNAGRFDDPTGSGTPDDKLVAAAHGGVVEGLITGSAASLRIKTIIMEGA
jgi:hypothetical protein